MWSGLHNPLLSTTESALMWQVCIGHLMLARLSGRQNSINEAPIWKATQDVDGETSEHWRTCWGLHQNHLWGYSAGLRHLALLGWSSGLTHTCLGRDWTQGPGEASHKGKKRHLGTEASRTKGWFKFSSSWFYKKECRLEWLLELLLLPRFSQYMYSWIL